MKRISRFRLFLIVCPPPAWRRWLHPDPHRRIDVPPRIARLAGLGAFGAIAAFVALYLLIVFISKPSQYAGLDGTLRFITWFTVAGVILALAGVHVVLGRQLLALARGDSPPA